MKWLTQALILSAVCILGLSFTSSAHAGGYHGYKYGYHGYKHGYRGHHYRHRHRHRDHRHSNRGAYLAGGLILGSILTHAYHRSQEPRVVHRTVVREPVVSTRTTGRRLFRDRDGNCFERTVSRGGDELLVELDRYECAW